jgi:hypothetical protein
VQAAFAAETAFLIAAEGTGRIELVEGFTIPYRRAVYS